MTDRIGMTCHSGLLYILHTSTCQLEETIVNIPPSPATTSSWSCSGAGAYPRNSGHEVRILLQITMHTLSRSHSHLGGNVKSITYWHAYGQVKETGEPGGIPYILRAQARAQTQNRRAVRWQCF